MTNPRDRRPGFTLFEMCAVIGLLTIVLALSAVVLIAAMQANRVGAATLLRLRLRIELEDQFLKDVAAADTAPDRLGDSVAGATCLILRQAGDRYVVYRWQERSLTRLVHDGKAESRSVLSAGPDVELEFERDGPLVRLRWIERVAKHFDRRSEIVAALGGDRQ